MTDTDRDTVAAKASMLEVMVEASIQGHDLRPFEPADEITGGYQSICRQCGQSLWVGENGLMYSLLEGGCSKSVGVGGE